MPIKTSCAPLVQWHSWWPWRPCGFPNGRFLGLELNTWGSGGRWKHDNQEISPNFLFISFMFFLYPCFTWGPDGSKPRHAQSFQDGREHPPSRARPVGDWKIGTILIILRIIIINIIIKSSFCYSVREHQPWRAWSMGTCCIIFFFRSSISLTLQFSITINNALDDHYQSSPHRGLSLRTGSTFSRASRDCDCRTFYRYVGWKYQCPVTHCNAWGQSCM